ncbi:hypothetical protein A3K63_03855 [Candidatus Micrarchaeota archaeon RBG_16_49_10]|nr:MAG: hypothetical protein A3K63_03855 [Candidatus Micrarchaeota archaeon RBG_16_49_10]
MVKIETLIKEKKVSRIKELELGRYVNFFESSYKDNLEHSKQNVEKFARWSIISGYYAMHDITKLFLAKKFRLKIELEVHATTIKVLRELIKDKEILRLIDKGYSEFISLATDLEEAKRERVKAQYYTGTPFMRERFKKRSKEFFKEVVLPYIQRMRKLLGD